MAPVGCAIGRNPCSNRVFSARYSCSRGSYHRPRRVWSLRKCPNWRWREGPGPRLATPLQPGDCGERRHPEHDHPAEQTGFPLGNPLLEVALDRGEAYVQIRDLRLEIMAHGLDFR